MFSHRDTEMLAATQLDEWRRVTVRLRNEGRIARNVRAVADTTRPVERVPTWCALAGRPGRALTTTLRWGDLAFEAAWRVGQSLSPLAVIEQPLPTSTTSEAAETRGQEPAPPRSIAQPAATDHQPCLKGLTTREVEVVRLIAAGRSNREIAAVLVLSVRTVERHIENVYAKLGVHGQAARAAVATYAAQHSLTQHLL